MRAFSHWDVAYRIKTDEIFRVVTPPAYGWVADPFLVEFKGEVLLFAEIFLHLSRRNGVIGYCKYTGNGFGDWKVTMDRHWHLSYPFVFVKNDHLYMIPESYQLNEVNLYRLNAFPNHWEKVKSYILNVEYCDSTVFTYKDGKTYMLTFERGKIPPFGIEYIYDITDTGVANRRIVSDRLEGARCAGRVFKDGERYIRVGQNSSEKYGGGLIFYEIDAVCPEYVEHEIYRIDPGNINTDKNKEYTGIHTYNQLNDMEVIDLKYQESSSEEEYASDRVRKVFVGTY
ncbi:MAG: hypothetical protein IJP92_10090 [Lachnospiraceae bacterium]|nr:hypothetical protein [Lachnospiraceae bacterium]